MEKQQLFQCSACAHAPPDDGGIAASVEPIQERTDLYRVTFHSPVRELVATFRLPPFCWRRCWTVDRNLGLIVSRSLISRFCGLRHRRERVITRRHATARLRRHLVGYRKVISSVRSESVAHPVNWEQFEQMSYLLYSHFCTSFITLLHALLYVRRRKLGHSSSGRV